jgi:hypothetical protein
MSLGIEAGSSTESLEDFLADPYAFFGGSLAAVQSMDRSRMLEMQRAGMVRRFAQQVEAIPMLAKLAERQGVSSLDDFNDVVPLLFEHTMYKSYPLALLEKQQFGRLTRWLDKLTSADLSSFDAGGLASIEQWLAAIDEQTPLDLAYTSGTTGTMSFIPWFNTELLRRARLHRMGEVQVPNRPPTEIQLSAPYHHIATPMKHRNQYFTEVFTGGDPAYAHPRRTRPSDADLLWLAARIRMAQMRGDASRIEVPGPLLARRSELEASEAARETNEQRWLEEVASLEGQRVDWMIFPFDLYTIVTTYPEITEHLRFDDDSVVILVGGNKGNAMPEGWLDTIRNAVGARIVYGYGMTEMSTMGFRCSLDRYHLQPWVIPFILDPDTSKPLPRTGRQTGRFAFFDLMPTSHWGGLMTGDDVELDYDGVCGCGATTQHLGADISRLSEQRGGDDKITCAATPEAYADAMNFLTGQ